MRFALVVALSIGVVGSVRAEVIVRGYEIPRVGTLELAVPMRWREEIGWTEGDHRPSVRFWPDEGDGFELRIDVLPRPVDAPRDFATLPWLRAVVEDSARRSLGVAEGRDLGLREIGEGQAVGWYYSLTDTALPDPPPEGAWRVMTQGATSAGGVVLTATLLTQRSWGPEIDAGLAVLRTARLTHRPADSWRQPGTSVVARAGLGQRYDLDVPDGFEIVSRSPLALRDRDTGARLDVDVLPGADERGVKGQLQRLQQEAERRAPGAWIVRDRGLATLGGRAAARLIVVDELRDEEVTTYALPLSDAVLRLGWRVNPTRAREARPRLDALLAGFRLK